MDTTGIYANQVGVMGQAEIRNVAIDFSDKLETGVTLSSPTFTEEGGGSDFVVNNETVSTAVLTINGRSVPIGQAIQARLNPDPGVLGDYRFTVSAVTSDGQGVTGIITVRVVDDTP